MNLLLLKNHRLTCNEILKKKELLALVETQAEHNSTDIYTALTIKPISRNKIKPGQYFYFSDDGSRFYTGYTAMPYEDFQKPERTFYIPEVRTKINLAFSVSAEFGESE